MKLAALIFCLFCFSFCSLANRDSALKNTNFKIIPSDYKNNFEINKNKPINFKLPYPVWPRDMDLTEGIICSIGGTFLVPLIIDVNNERTPSQLSLIGLGAFGTCFVAEFVYRFGIKGKYKKQKKWDK